ncbi:MAG: TonB C-terminal domain-containing protein [Lentisphaeria bacterium]|nr:TonB C-terminal domain-containing protein [Lentisphaeria bacterium]
MIYGSTLGNHSSFLTDRIPGEAPLPYIRGGRRSLIIAAVVLFHAGLLAIPCFFMVAELVDPPVYVMRMPVVESLPNDQPEMSPHPSPAAAKPVGTPELGKPLTDIPSVPELVRPVDPPPPPPPQPKPEPQKTVKAKPDPVKPTPVKESKRVAPAAPKTKPKTTARTTSKVTPKTPTKKNSLLTPDQIKISHTRVKPSQNNRISREQQRQIAEQQARDARNAAAAQALRSMTGEVGGRGTPGGGGGPKGIVSREISDYYNQVETFLKRRWEQPQIYGSARPKVLVLFRVTSTGEISFKKIEKLSGVPAMDASVEALLADLRTLPAPPKPMEFTVTIEIDR